MQTLEKSFYFYLPQPQVLPETAPQVASPQLLVAVHWPLHDPHPVFWTGVEALASGFAIANPVTASMVVRNNTPNITIITSLFIFVSFIVI